MSDLIYDCKFCPSYGKKGYFRAITYKEFERHVAVEHCEGAYSTFQCGRCKGTFYDDAHFKAHLDANPTCHPMEVTMEPCILTKEDFGDLASQMLNKATSSPLPISLETTTPSLLPVEAIPTSLFDFKMEVDTASSSNGTVSDGGCSSSKSSFSLSDEMINGNGLYESGTTNKENAPKVVNDGMGNRTAIAGAPPSSKDVETNPRKNGPLNGDNQKDTSKSKNGKRTNSTINSVANVSLDDPIVDCSCKRQNISYHEFFSSDTTDDSDDGNEQESKRKEMRTPKVEAKKEEYTEDEFSKTKLVDICQLCVELGNNRGPIALSSEKDAHAIAHLKFAPSFVGMSDRNLRCLQEFTKQFRCCFEDGFYKSVKRQYQLKVGNGRNAGTGNNGDDVNESSESDAESSLSEYKGDSGSAYKEEDSDE